MLLNPKELQEPTEVKSDSNIYLSDSSEEGLSQIHPMVIDLFKKYKKAKVTLLEELMFRDSCSHMLLRDEKILYHKRIKKNKLEEKLRVKNVQKESEFLSNIQYIGYQNK